LVGKRRRRNRRNKRKRNKRKRNNEERWISVEEEQMNLEKGKDE
jgi:hypothetical protein